ITTPPIDAVMLFQIYASAKKKAYSDVIVPEIRIPARVLNVNTGQFIASEEIQGLEDRMLPDIIA
ncbi:MAG: hypothetical protein AAGF32_09440, partial [Pseudomonadota bacterium]